VDGDGAVHDAVLDGAGSAADGQVRRFTPQVRGAGGLRDRG
jgi:hypothetical protein